MKSKFTMPILLLLLSLFSTVEATQTRQRARQQQRTSQVKTQPTPQATPTSAPPQKSELELTIERDIAKDKVAFSKLTPDDRAAVRAALARYERAIRIYQLRSSPHGFLLDLTKDKTEQIWDKADAVLPPSALKNFLTNLRRAILDAATADDYYRDDLLRLPEGADIFLKIVDRYKLQGVPGYLIGRRVIEQAAQFFEFAKLLAEKTGIIEAQGTPQ